MRSHTFVVLAIYFFAKSNSSPDSVDNFNRISSSLLRNSTSEIKITEEKQINKIEMKSQDSNQSAFSSQFLHQGHNLFYQPQILIGPDINAPFLSRRIAEKERKEQVEILTNKIESNKIETSNKNETFNQDKQTIVLIDIPDAPTLPPPVMPKLPTAVIVQEYQKPAPVEVIIEQHTVVMPEPPVFIPPRIPHGVILQKPVSHVPTCLMDLKYEITVPCPPTITGSPAITGTGEVIVEETLLVPERSSALTLHLPKIPLGIIYNKPVKTIMPYSEGFVSTTRFLPSVKVSKIPLEGYNHQKLLIARRPTSELFIENRENVRVIEEEERFSSFSAYCAHNIALERVLQNIVVGKEIVRVKPLSRVQEIPIRPVY